MLKNWSEQLVRIYNTLSNISTKGEDTLAMSDCLRALEQVVVSMNQEQNTTEHVSDEKEQ